jgi:hypothetical protein
MGFWGLRIAFAVTAAVSAWLTTGDARAANGAFAVDAADISEVGSCKVESWMSTATNSDFSAVANPSCVANIFKPVELSLLTNRSRSDGDWSTSIAPKAKWNIVPTGIGKFGFSFYAGGSFDALTGENLTAFAVVPATYRLSETMRINVNAGWLWDRIADRHYLTYGLGFDWKFTDAISECVLQVSGIGDGIMMCLRLRRAPIRRPVYSGLYADLQKCGPKDGWP